ncbi:class I SAM-dependent methyltransferase [Gordonia jinhuaensis]|uniref:class I SAM-dependent methyltransferase n=1 Tax=Gordonia jinhuaensis TaxID=1517702 RepID=UPI001E3CA44D|nr:class I SAM-dependent methyltransferase [Gordonia jinhuaensis]
MTEADPLARLRRRATWRRAAHLLAEFRYEQPDPARFYTALARDTADLLADLYGDVCDRDLNGGDLEGTIVLDVGGGPGYFADEFARRGAHYYSVEPDPSEMHAAGLPQRSSVRGSGTALPFATDSVDICFSSNVAEHIAAPWRMGEEMLRVTRPGGLVVYSYTLWYGPFGGHEMGLTHYLGGARAARWYTRRHGHPPKNLYGTSLFALTATDGLRWARRAEAAGAGRLVAALPRYLPARLWPIMRIPLLREVLGSNLMLVFVAAEPPVRHSSAGRCRWWCDGPRSRRE